SDRRADGRLPATHPRRAVPRQVPQRLRQTGVVQAGRSGEGEVHAARRVPHAAPRPPLDGSGAIDMVPARGPQPADVLRHLQREREGLQEADAPRLPRQRTPVEDHGGCAKVSGMNEEAGFIAALLAEPDDRTTLLVYAD